MTGIVFGLVALCLAFVAHGMPVEVLIAPPQPQLGEDDSMNTGPNAQLLGGGFQGDMLFPEGFDPTNPGRGVAIYGDNYRWPNGIIPYDISAITNAQDQKKITDAMNTLMYDVATPKSGTTERAACIYFRPVQAGDKNYFKIQYGNGCSAHVGHITGQRSTMTLQQNGCFYPGTIQHELMHVIGFHHEQCRPDRDTYLQVNLENVEPSMQHNFNKYQWGSSVFSQNTPYDYASVMHYEMEAFSKNGKPTMVPRVAGTKIGKAQALSPTDVAEVRHLYNCKA